MRCRIYIFMSQRRTRFCAITAWISARKTISAKSLIAPDMNRQESITRYINKRDRGVEIAPWHSPLVPKKDGYNSLTLDLFDTPTLRTNAEHHGISGRARRRIEDVDLVG